MTYDQENLYKRINSSAYSGLIDKKLSSDDAFRPKLVFNNGKSEKVVTTISRELKNCKSFAFSVAFITESGFERIIQHLKDLEDRNIPGRILTSDYLAFTEPKALKRLTQFSNLEIKMYVCKNSNEGFHTKGYFFSYDQRFTKIIIGSSNLTANALTTNKEWNLILTSTDDGSLVEETSDEFEYLWNHANPVEQILDEYEKIYASKKAVQLKQPIKNFDLAKLTPNSMQVNFVKNLEELIFNGQKRGLLISSTGTGKTYASAFGIQRIKPKRILFLAHREQILNQSIKAYKTVFGSVKTFNKIVGSESDFDFNADFTFATMQTLQKDSNLSRIKPDDFDFIVVDEVHRAGSSGYLKILEYFNAKFVLGMTATPERADDFDIFKLFDNNIIQEIRLQDALDYDLLCPFHYFGITDLKINGEEIDDKSQLSNLACEERVRYIIEKANFYGFSGDRVKGLIFVSRKEEGQALSDSLNNLGFRTKFLSGADSQQTRIDSINRLVCNSNSSIYNDRFDYIITVDIFNEGVDIPEINQVLLLRPTKSPIVFVQQLGRGLRKYKNKEFVVVIDFIANYTNNYMIPMALYGDRTQNKDTLRRLVLEGDNLLSGASSVNFDKISKEKIFKSIDSAKFGLRDLRRAYSDLKHKIGKIPNMYDFDSYGSVDPLLFIEKCKSYYSFLNDNEPAFKGALNNDELTASEYVSSSFASGKRPYELLILKSLLQERKITLNELDKEVYNYQVKSLDKDIINSINSQFDLSFYSKQFNKRYSESVLVDFGNEEFMRSIKLDKFITNQYFADALQDIVHLGLVRYFVKYSKGKGSLSLYQKYSRRDACWLLNNLNDESATIFGYKYFNVDNSYPLFITYSKAADVSDSTNYDDHFIDRNHFFYSSKSNRNLSSKDIQDFINLDERGIKLHVFIKKSDDEGSDFYYFGKAHVENYFEDQMDSNRGKIGVVHFRLKLENPADENLYDYFTYSQDNIKRYSSEYQLASI